MTTEPIQPAAEADASSAAASSSMPTNGASQGHRRRRRRRKNKNAAANANPVSQGSFPGNEAAAPAEQQPAANNTATQQRSEGGFSKTSRRKKRRTKQHQGGFKPEPGNSILPQGGGGKRKSARQKGPREFVGPMDHSYRSVNGNIADGPPATIMQAANGNYYTDTSMRGQSAPAISPDAPTRIFLVIEDLFFVAKIQEVSRKIGVKVEFVKGDKDIVSHLAETADADHPSLVVFDLNNAAVKSLTLIPKLKSKLKKSISVIGFLSHIQGDLKIKAIEAGCDTVMPRSAFSQSLPNLLRRYGIDEEDEYYPQPV